MKKILTIMLALAFLSSAALAQGDGSSEFDQAKKDLEQLGAGVSEMMGTGLTEANFFAAGSYHQGPIRYGNDKRLDWYISPSLMLGYGTFDNTLFSSAIESIEGRGGNTGAFDPLKEISDAGAFPAPYLGAIFRVRPGLKALPDIFERIDAHFKIGTFSSEGFALGTPDSDPEGIDPNNSDPFVYNAKIWGFGGRFRVIDRKILKVALGGSLNGTSGELNAKYLISDYTLDETGGSRLYMDQLLFDLQNSWSMSTIGVDAAANLTLLRIFKLFGGIAFDIGSFGGNDSSYQIKGTTYFDPDDDGALPAAVVPNGQLDVNESTTYDPSAVGLRYFVGLKFLIFEAVVEANETADSAAVRAGLSFSF